MFKTRLRRTATLLSASAVLLGTVSTGLLAGNADAAPATPGVTAHSITIGASVPLSGLAASYKSVSGAAAAVFQYINKKGGVNGRKINYIRLDDCYNLAAYGLGCTAGASTTTLSVNQKLVAQDHVFATVGSLGTAAQESVLSYLKSNGVPQLFVNSGSSAWSQPSKYPNLFGFQTSYQEEGKIFAKYIKAHFPGKKVGFIGQNDDFGANGYTGLMDGHLNIAASDHLSYNAADAITGSSNDIQQDIATLKADNVSVVVLDSVPGFTAGILQVAALEGFSPQWVISSVGSDPTSVNSAGEAGAVTLTEFPPATSKSDAWIPWLRKVLKADTADFPGFNNSTILTGNEVYGASFAIAFAEALKSEGKNVTRAGFVATLKSTNLATPAIIPLRYTNGNHQGLAGGTIAIIAGNGGKPPVDIFEGNTNTFLTTSAANSPIKSGSFVVAPIPSWIK